MSASSKPGFWSKSKGDESSDHNKQFFEFLQLLDSNQELFQLSHIFTSMSQSLVYQYFLKLYNQQYLFHLNLLELLVTNYIFGVPYISKKLIKCV